MNRFNKSIHDILIWAENRLQSSSSYSPEKSSVIIPILQRIIEKNQTISEFEKLEKDLFQTNDVSSIIRQFLKYKNGEITLTSFDSFKNFANNELISRYFFVL